ncbi:ABC transporter ATP-binding protein [Alcanivorax sp. JB21]|uniref:ABC transporter ATP-binding protein n=1 Tax=Alcanivorax limicola TaxID=2874102 RepID=UPI001CBF6556|nr:ABC transporter ATP-binding protein [Alcanivorax limicola]MBZ2189356.1 ABC transporter ATP-binding protein [Alcanivorax limicola]
MNAVSAAERAPVLDLQQVSFRWRRDLPPVLTIPAFQVAAGERVFLAGPSGAGKSTLLALIAGIAIPQTGDVQVLGRSLPGLGAAARDRFRADHLGVIFQMFNLLPYLPVLDNVMLPCRFSPARRQQAVARDGSQEAQARRLLGALGLQADAMLRRPVTELSVGQQQRVAAARALMGAPDLVIADEPTSALDADRRLEFVELLAQECDASGAALLFVSHDLSLAPRFQRQVSLAEINAALPEGSV